MHTPSRADSKLVPFGSVWWILDSVLEINWKRRDWFHGRSSGRHPVLIVAQNYRVGAAERIPTLFGRSKEHIDAFVVCGLTPSRSSREPTYFFDALLPLAPPIFISNDPVSGQPFASQNASRPKLSTDDEGRLREWLRAHVRRRRKWDS